MKNTTLLKNTTLGLAAIAVGLFSSCRDEANDASLEPVNPTTNTSPENTNASNANGGQTAKVNPAHGLPGHTCALPVGAPLDGPANTTQSTPAATPARSSTVSPLRIDQSPQVNPPHGQPGHDCTIPVGAELKKQ